MAFFVAANDQRNISFNYNDPEDSGRWEEETLPQEAPQTPPEEVPPQVPPAPKNPNAKIGTIWTNINRVSSDAQTMDVELQELTPGAMEPIGTWAVVDGKTKLGGIFKYGPFEPEKKQPGKPPKAGSSHYHESYPLQAKPESAGTNDGFDQVQLYNSLTSMQLYLVNNIGIDIKSIIASQHNGQHHGIRAHANGTSVMNAYYSPQSDDLTFGTSNGIWHLAADSDVTTHEAGHLILDHQAPGLSRSYSGEGGAIHEGFGDALAALIADDPEISEDFPPAMGEKADKGKGLRTVDHKLKLGDVDTEVHNRGQIYGAYFWSIKKRLMASSGMDSREAAGVTLALMGNFAPFLTFKPQPKHFVQALMKGAEAIASTGKLGIPLSVLQEAIQKEGIDREMIKNSAELNDISFNPAYASKNINGVIATAQKGNSNITFASAGKKKVRGGGSERYEQYLKITDNLKARVLGGSILTTFDKAGNVKSVSSEDLRAIKPDEISREMTVSKSAAIALVKKEAARLMDAAEKEKAVNALKFAKPVKKDIESLKQIDARYLMADAANKTVAKLNEQSASLVVLPGEKDLSYEFKMGLSLYYVNANTGKVTVEKDMIWD